MTTFSSPLWNHSAASNRNFAWNDRRSSVSPPPCAYLVQAAYRRDHEPYAVMLAELPLSKRRLSVF
ncbi:hypothetical protein [Streptomyces iakyrus]|uniref:hypothetical protein n=1 Tax=Streptomyces iakyrus TaxID=68219 RepID=UPI0033CF47B3